MHVHLSKEHFVFILDTVLYDIALFCVHNQKENDRIEFTLHNFICAKNSKKTKNLYILLEYFFPIEIVFWKNFFNIEYYAFCPQGPCWVINRRIDFKHLTCLQFVSWVSICQQKVHSLKFNWSIVDLQCCVNFCCTAQ